MFLFNRRIHRNEAAQKYNSKYEEVKRKILEETTLKDDSHPSIKTEKANYEFETSEIVKTRINKLNEQKKQLETKFATISKDYLEEKEEYVMDYYKYLFTALEATAHSTNESLFLKNFKQENQELLEKIYPLIQETGKEELFSGIFRNLEIEVPKTFK